MERQTDRRRDRYMKKGRRERGMKERKGVMGRGVGKKGNDEREREGVGRGRVRKSERGRVRE